MKAWIVKDKDEYCATVVFAETRGKARAAAMLTDTCEDVNFCDIEVRRRPQLDKYYVEGKREMDWFNSRDRIALVKDAGFYCGNEYWKPEDCQECPAKEWCDKYQDLLTDKEGADT